MASAGATHAETRMPARPWEDAFVTLPEMVTFDQATVTTLEVACRSVPIWDASMTAVYA